MLASACIHSVLKHVCFTFTINNRNRNELKRNAMEGNLSSSESISNVDIYQNYMVAPQAMHMKMHMLGFMFAPSNKLTLLLMVNYLNNDMDLITKMGVDFTTKSSGLSDLKLGGLLKLWNKNKQTLHTKYMHLSQIICKCEICLGER